MTLDRADWKPRRGSAWPFPFRRAAGGVIDGGTTSPMSVARADNSLWWLGVDGLVYRSNGYNKVRVSTHAIEAIIGLNLNGLYGMTRIPTGGIGFYSITVGQRSDARHPHDGLRRVHRRVARAGDQRGRVRLLADAGCRGGQQLDQAVRRSGVRDALHDGHAGDGRRRGYVLRQATFPPLWAETRRAFCARVEVEMEVGGAESPGPVTLEWSDDGARTWGPTRTMSAGVPGDYRSTEVFRPRGSARSGNEGVQGFQPTG